MRLLGVALQFVLPHALIWPVLAGVALFGVASGGPLGGPEPASAQTPTPTVTVLFAGWNNVVYQGVSLPLPDALNDARDDVSIIWQLEASSQTWRVWATALPTVAVTLPGLEPGGVYFLFSHQARLWTQPLTAPAAPSLPPPDPPPSAGLWQVQFTRTASILGLEQTLTFDERGAGSAGSGPGGSQPVTVAAGSRATVGAILTANDFFAGATAEDLSGCVNCFHYTLAIRDRSGNVITVQTDDLRLSGALFTLVEEMTRVLLAALS